MIRFKTNSIRLQIRMAFLVLVLLFLITSYRTYSHLVELGAISDAINELENVAVSIQYMAHDDNAYLLGHTELAEEFKEHAAGLVNHWGNFKRHQVRHGGVPDEERHLFDTIDLSLNRFISNSNKTFISYEKRERQKEIFVDLVLRAAPGPVAKSSYAMQELMLLLATLSDKSEFGSDGEANWRDFQAVVKRLENLIAKEGIVNAIPGNLPAILNAARKLHLMQEEVNVAWQEADAAGNDIDAAVASYIAIHLKEIAEFKVSARNDFFIMMLVMILGSVLMAYRIGRTIAIPVEDLVAAAEQFQMGNFEHRTRVDQSNELGVVGTAFNNMADQVQEFQNTLERKEMSRMKGEFVSTVSHELRTPLTSIRGSLGLVIGGVCGELPDKAAQMVELGYKNTEKLITLVNDLLDMEKLQLGKTLFHMKKASLTEIVANSIEVNKPFADEMKTKIELTETVADAVVNGDSDRLSQVLTNLLSNAAKFSPEGDTVGVSLVRTDTGFRISVSDHGPGIPDEFRKKIFDRFTQSDSSDIRQNGGSGLGLYISKAIVEKHGGVLDFESEPGKGATFYFDLLEFGKDQPASPTPVDPGGSAINSKIIEGHRILIIEDDPNVAEILTVMLEQRGAVCDTAHDLAEARKKLADSTYQLITMDILLPDGGGMGFVQELRKDGATADIPVVVVSVVATESREQLLTSVMGVMEWIEKPIDEKQLFRAVTRATNRDRQIRKEHISVQGGRRT